MRFLPYILVAALAGTACEKDEFAQAPTVSAPEQGAVTAKPITNDTPLPANHPPMGGQQAAPLAQAAAQVKFSGPAEFGKTGPLRWSAPESWTAAVPASSMRLAEYVAPAADGSQPGEVSIFYFGPGGGGGVEANVARWIGQFKNPDGTPATGQQSTETVSGMMVHRVEAAGTFNPGMAGNGVSRDNYKMLGAIVESPAGLYFFKMVGPTDTIGARAPEFESLVKSFAPGA